MEFPSHIKTQFEFVTPDEAQHYLDTMHKNRTKSQISVDVHTDNLTEGTFFPAISPVFLDADHRPWDGQHRFRAIVESGVGAWLNFVIGVTPEEARFIDTGRKRTMGDSLSIDGVIDANKRASVARLMAVYDRHGMDGIRNSSRSAVTDAQVRSFVETEEMGHAVRRAASARAAIGVSPTYFGYAMLRTDPYSSFWESVISGEDLAAGHPALTLRNWYIATSTARTNVNPASQKMVELFALTRCWNAWVKGQELHRVTPHYDTTATGRRVFKADHVPDFLPASLRK